MMASQQGKSQVLGGKGGGKGMVTLFKKYCRVSPLFNRTRKKNSSLNFEPSNLNFVMVLSVVFF